MKVRVKVQEKNYEVVIGDMFTRPIQAEIDGEIFEVWPEETSSVSTRQQPPLNSNASAPNQLANDDSKSKMPFTNTNLVRAPIPGVIIEIKVKVGDAVVFGQELCILEAMKMKNAIRAGKAGIISKIQISAGDQVSQNQTLIEYGGEA